MVFNFLYYLKQCESGPPSDTNVGCNNNHTQDFKYLFFQKSIRLYYLPGVISLTSLVIGGFFWYYYYRIRNYWLPPDGTVMRIVDALSPKSKGRKQIHAKAKQKPIKSKALQEFEDLEEENSQEDMRPPDPAMIENGDWDDDVVGVTPIQPEFGGLDMDASGGYAGKVAPSYEYEE